MAHMLETMAWAENEGPPWHGLGNKVSNKLTPEQMATAACCDWTVSKRKIFFDNMNGGSTTELEQRYALVRDSDNKPFDVVTERWKPVQNIEGFSFFKKFVAAGHMEMETAGSLWGGKIVWALARVKKDFKLGKADEVRSYLLMALPHQLGKAMIYQFTPIRVVCWNTLSWALGSSLKGDGSGFRLLHSQKWDDSMKAAAEQALGLASHQMEEFKELSGLLVKKRVAESVTEEFFCEVLRFDPKKSEKDEPRMLPKFREALAHAPGAQMDTSRGTMWGALNAVTYTIDHDTGKRDRGVALKNAWFGHLSNVKRRAVDLAVQYAKKGRAA